MTKHNILFIGLDTHKTFTEVGYIEDERGAKPIHLGKILSNKAAFTLVSRVDLPQPCQQIVLQGCPHEYVFNKKF